MHPDVEAILESTRRRAREAERRVEGVDARDFRGAVEAAESRGWNPVIAEVKPSSPTMGESGRDPVETARRMVEGGAVAISVLTEPEHFGGSLEALREVRREVDVPVLRKDFVLEESQLYEVKADLVLLIAAFLDDGRLSELVGKAREIGFEPLVEIHSQEELRRALATEAGVIGVNNRDLKRLEVDLGVGERLLPGIPDDCVAVAESGVSSQADVRRLREAGADALLVGTSIMRSDDVAGKTRMLVEA